MFTILIFVITRSNIDLFQQETNHEIEIPERNVTYIVLSVYLLTLIHREPLNQNHTSQSRAEI